jgi:hypothetical protein
MVVGCAISVTRNYLKIHMPRTLNPLFSNIHAKARKLWKHSAMRPAASRTDSVYQSTNRPLMNSACPPRCPLHSPRLPYMRTWTSPRAGVASIIEITANIQSALAARPLPNFPRLRALVAFGRRPRCKPQNLDRPSSETHHISRHSRAVAVETEVIRLDSNAHALGSLEVIPNVDMSAIDSFRQKADLNTPIIRGRTVPRR